MRKMVMKLDPEGTPRAWGIGKTEEQARAEADRQLAIYRKRKAEVEDFYLAEAEYTEQVATVD